ncbi:uncharacterized protein LOC143276252 isoform X2 [Babylonia areolata]|uniref:uncharacterized protein LOC143276252 isoform X2 n=1 Tax=Babylonia areolata TaxID=304850 RepID=UPI003FD25653
MSTQENKKAKRRKNKVATGKYAATIPQANEVTEVVTEENRNAERIAQIMDATDERDIMPAFNKGPNPFMDKEKCLLCGKDKPESFTADAEGSVSEDSNKVELDGHSFDQFQVWVCQSCRNSTDGVHRSFDYKSVCELPIPAVSLNPGQEISLDQASLGGMLGDLNVFPPSTGEPTLPNGSVCNCDSCMERRQITQEYEQETKALQTVWTTLRTTVRRLYALEVTSLSEEEAVTFRNQVDKLCSRDPHQLFQRLESQVREFVIEIKMNLRKKINSGYSTPPQAKEIMSMLLEEYNNLSNVARIVSENLSTLKDHLRRFNVTWELHNKHLYHTIVYTEPTVQGCLETLCEQLRYGALDKDSYTEDTYPNLMKSFVSFRNEMSVILVLWHDCQQLIDRYNEEQAALKVKQKWLKEDWEFFKAQRKILEQQVLKSNPKASMPHSMEAQFTETMRNMLTGQKPPAEESHCPRCSRKRCPCDECTITHMITCGIINPEQLETNGSHRTFNFPPDSNRYIIDVSPPSMSSTTSSSASSSPVPITREMATNHLSSCSQSSQGDNREMEEKTSRVDEGDDKEDDADNEDNDNNDEDDDDDDNEEDEDDDGEDEDEEEGDADEEDDEDDDDEDDDGISEDQKEFDAMLASGKLGMPTAPVVVPSAEGFNKLWGAMCQQQSQQSEEALELNTQDYPNMGTPPCACHHCVSPAQTETRVDVSQQECQCHICLEQRGQTVSTALPTSLPIPARPSGLHLYPHIHGTLPVTHSQLHIAPHHAAHPMVNHAPHTQDRSLLQPQLYNLHSARLPFKLDIEDPDSIHDHLLSAYGDWDNSSYDSSRILGPPPHRFSTTLSQDLLPPPPMTADAPFSLEALSSSMATPSHAVAASHIMLGSSSMATTTSSAFKAVATAGFATGIPPAFQIPTEQFVQDTTTPTSTSSSAQPQHTSSVPELNLNLRSTALSSLPLSFSPASPSSVSSLPLPLNPPPSTRPVTLGGNVGTSPAPGKEQRTYAQPCKKYTSSSPQNSGFGSVGKAGVSPPPPPPSSHNHLNVSLPGGVQATSGKSAPKPRQAPASSQPSHSCSHSQHMVHSSGGESQVDGHAGVGMCSSASALPTTINNVSVGTSTLCTDPDCQSHHDDNCDSIDDSCSEKSSSTSTSNNQKEGKYCDCCYCEFFGHGNPPVAQTSKNYAEMRERLRRRLKQRTEAKQGGSNHGSQSDIQDSAANMNVDELLKFINGTDSEGSRGESQQSSRAAKRARQKQRKAEERLRQEEEERKQKLAAQRLLEAEKVNSAGQKKKGKHKEERQQRGSTAVRSEGPPSGSEVSKSSQTKSITRAKQRLKEEQSDNQAEKIGGPTLAAPVTSSTFTGTRQEVTTSRPSAQNSVGRSVPAGPLTSDREAKKSVEVFQPPAHLMRSLAEQTLQQASSLASTTPSMSSPAPLPTLGGQPNSPTAKKAKRRLAPAGTQGQLTAQRKLLTQPPSELLQLEIQRRNEAKQEVAKQMKEIEELSQQQTQLRKQMQQSPMKQVQQTQMLQQMLKKDQEQRQQEQEKQQQQQQQKLVERKRMTQQRTLHKPPAQLQQQQLQQQRLQTPAQPEASVKQCGGGKPNPALPQPSKPVTTNGMAPQHQATMANHGRLANGVAVMARPSQSCPVSSPATASAPVSSKQLASGANGLTNQAQIALSADNHAHIANMQRKASPENQEQTEQTKNTKGKTKKKKKQSQDIRAVDEVFMPRPEEELESNDMDEAEWDIEMFKRFVMETPTPPRERQKLDINLNMKDIFSKKKGGMGCI